MKENIEKVVYKAIQVLNEDLEDKIDLSTGLETRLFGGSGVLDSMELVNLVVAIEEEIENEFGVTITLADEKAMSRRTSPFSSVKYLVAYIEELLQPNSL